MRSALSARIRALAVVPMLIGILLASAPPASAHVARKEGPYSVEIGWGDEPTYAGNRNSVELLITDAKGNPINDLGDTLSVEVTFGSEKQTFKFEPNFIAEEGEIEGTPGDYRAWLIPTSAGKYTFHVTGAIKAQKIDFSITSGETTFDDVDDPSGIQFPAKVPNGADLDKKIDRIASRASSDAADAADTGSQARTVAIIAGVIGLAGVVIGGLALRKR